MLYLIRKQYQECPVYDYIPVHKHFVELVWVYQIVYDSGFLLKSELAEMYHYYEYKSMVIW